MASEFLFGGVFNCHPNYQPPKIMDTYIFQKMDSASGVKLD
jgi:hypothetical protein